MPNLLEDPDGTQTLFAWEALRDSEARYRTLFGAIDTGFCVIEVIFDEHGKATDYMFVETNSAFESQSGIVGAVGRRIREFAPNLEDVWFERYGRVVLTGESFRIEDEAAPLGKWFDINAFRVGQPEQCRVGVLVNDMTARRKIEAQVREGERRLRSAVDIAALGLWEWDLVAGSVFMDARAREMFGYSADEPIVADDVFKRVDHADRERAIAESMHAAETCSAIRSEYDLLLPDGTRRSLASTAQPIGDSPGPAERFVGTFYEVTEQRAARRALLESNATLERRVEERTAERDRMWETSPDLMLVIDFEGYLRRVNPAWTKLLGYAPDELVGHHVNGFVLPDDHRKTVVAYETAAEGGHPTVENRYQHKDGSVRWLSWVAAPAGQMTYATGRDVTAEKEAAAELERAQEALRQSQKMEAVGQLTSGLAHDFNNLLAGISGSLDMMQTRIAQGRVAEIDRYMIGAQGAAKRAAALTHRLLAFSRRQTLEPKPTDVNRLVAGMEDLIRRTVGPQVEVETVTKGGLWSVLVDPNQLENALLNLCINARDAMPDGGRIIIETANRWLDDRAGRERDLPPGQYVSMCVSDNGSGMPKDVVDRAFDPFFTTKPIGVGTGLGLSMIYGFARQSGGQIQIYSEVGQGTMICLHLPRHSVAAELETEPVAETIVRSEETRTVLVIDDEPLVRMLVVDAVEDLGYTALEAGDGPQGLKILRSGTHLDLLITDVGLPNGMNGRQVAEAARELRPGLKVLFVTGYAENAVLKHGHLDPGMQVVTKPFDMNALTRRIQGMITD